MYHILIVDDDSIIRERLARLCAQLCGAQAQLHQAANGMRAVELVCSQRIDLIFADIKMPVCDGIEMMEKLGSLQYPGQVVVISGFDDFAFVRSAMKLGAVDYLLKPVEEPEFAALLDKCLQNADTRRSFAGERHSVMESFFRQQRTLERLLGEADYPAVWLVQEGLGPASRCAFYLLDALSQGRSLQTEKQALFLSVEAAFSRCFDRGACRLVQGEMDNLWAAAILGPGETVYAGLRELRGWLDEQEYRYGAATCLRTPEELPLSRREAAAALDLSFYNLPPAPADGEAYPYEELAGALCGRICACEREACGALLDGLFARLCRDHPPVEDARQLLAGLAYRVMSQNASFISVISRYKFSANDIMHNIQDAPNALRLLESVRDDLFLYLGEVQERLGTSEDYAVQKARGYIEQGYRDEISLSEISEKLGLNPNYLSTLFKAKTGVTYSQYLRSVRIRKAKELMRDSRLKLYAIAELVGYKDNAHFYRAFKEETGLPPAQYKKQQL